MAELTKGSVTVTYADHIEIPSAAGTLSSADLSHLEKARSGVGITAVLTAAAIRKFPDIAPKDVTADELERMGRQADDIDLLIADVDKISGIFKQANVMIDAKTQEMLRKVLAQVRGQEKFDAGIVDSVPQLIEYFKTRRPGKGPKTDE